MLKESISQKKETVYSIQHNIRSKEQQCENERLRVEQVVDSITNTAKNSENEIVSLRKLLSKDLSVSEKQVKSLQVKRGKPNCSYCLCISEGALYGPQIIMLKREDKSTTPNSYSSG
jgi:hypothetical protein